VAGCDCADVVVIVANIAKPAVSSAPKPSRPAKSAASAKIPAPPATVTLPDPPPKDPPPVTKRIPAIHIDVQVHISPDTTPEQIDKIFASMSKHLGGFVN
jgi:hypothetical protein